MSTPLWRSRPTGFDIQPANVERHAAINDFIHVSEGTTNSYLLVTRDGRIVINTGLGFEALVHKRYFDSVDRGPVRYIILTQGHVDHVGGADHFREGGTEIIAHANNPAQQADDARIQPFRTRRSYFAWAAAIDGKSRPQGGQVPVQSRPSATILVHDRFAFELGGLRVEVIACTGAETTDSLLVWLPDHRICITSNIFGALFGHFPNLVTIRGDRYRDPLPYMETLDVARELGAEMLLIGHGSPIVGAATIRAELERMKGAVLHVHDAVVKAMNDGKDLWTAMREITLPPELEQGEGYGKLSWSIRAIWEMYAGWFHHQSTTELYPVPHWSVHPDLVQLAGGPDPIAAAALRKAESAPVEALHLAEIALAGEPAHRGALAASLAAHRTLLAQSVNFWEARWLEHQIRTLEKKLDPQMTQMTQARTGKDSENLKSGSVSSVTSVDNLVRISDLGAPQLNDAQRAAIAYADSIPISFSEDAVLAAARKQTGLSDFGDDDFRPRLRVWLQAVEEDDRLGPLGRLGLFGNCVRFLSNRLRLEDLLRRHPEILATPISQPIIVAGLPRSGTTHLLNLLAADARLRSLPYWEALEPIPVPGEGPARDGRDPRYERCAKIYAGIDARLPLLKAMHDMPPEHIHEEVELLDIDFASYQLEWVCRAPRWRDYYLTLDMRRHYAYMRKALQALQWLRGPRRWVLKSPQHLEQLAPLRDVFPDATIVLTHRDPVAVIQSAITMMAYGERLRRTRIDLDALASYWTDRVERLLRACVRDHDRLPPAQTVDVLFHDLMADDMAVVADIYARANLPVTADARAEMSTFARANSRGKHGQVIYDLQGDFGIDPATLRRRFDFYFERFAVRAE